MPHPQETNKESEEKSKGPKYNTVQFWIDRAKATEEVFKKRFWKSAKAAWREYELGENLENRDEGSEAGTGRQLVYAKLFPIYWSSIKTLAPAYWSKVPISIALIRYGSTDPDARTGAKLIEHLGTFSLETTPFDQVMRDSTIELIVSDVVTTRVMLEGEPKQRQIPITQNKEGGDQYTLENGKPYTGQMIGDGEGGQMFGQEDYFDNLKCYPMALSHGDMMWTPEASCEDEIDEEYFRFCYPEHEAYEMFPDVPQEELRQCMQVYGKHKDDGDYDTVNKVAKSDGPQEYFLHGWEIWHRKTRTVKFICLEYKNDFLKDSPDTYRLTKFFPTPCPIVGTKQRKSLFGVPSYRYVKGMCDQMHDVAMRIYKLSQAIRPRFIVDKSVETDVRNLISDADESEYIFIKNMLDIVEKGGLKNVIQALPVGELADALVQLSNLHEKYKNEFNEIFGIPDVLRGASDPLETAKAQEIKSFAATNRFRDQMNMIAGLGRDTLELLIDLKLGAYTQEQIFKICGTEYMDEDDQKRLQQAYALITNDQERIIRIDFETDSTSYINERIDQQNRNVAIKTVMEGMKALNGMPPQQQVMGFKVIQSALAGMRLGKDYMDDIEELMKQLMEQLKQPPPPPPPDVEMMKVQQQDQKNQMDGMMRSRELDQKEMKLVGDNQKSQVEVSLKARETDIKQFKVTIEKQKVDNDAQFESMRIALEDVTSRFMMAMEQNKFTLEEFKAMAQAMEAQREEVRLAKDSNLAMVKAAADFEKRAEPQIIHMEPPVIPPAPPTKVEVIMPEPKSKKRRRVVRPVKGKDGKTRYDIEDIEEEPAPKD